MDEEFKNAKKLLSSYDIDINRGFLREYEPTQRLCSYYDVWEDIINDISYRIASNRVRDIIKNMPLLSIDLLKTNSELERAMLILSMLGMAYVWGEPLSRLLLLDNNNNNYVNDVCFDINEPLDIPIIIPESLAKPWVEIANKLDRPPILSHASIVLANWRFLDGANEVYTGNIALLNSFYGGLDEHWFYLITVELENVGAKALKYIVNIFQLFKINDDKKIIKYMKNIEICIENMKNVLNKMIIGNDPYIFYKRVRVFLSGWAGNPLLPKGVIYENQYNNKPQWFHGGSAAQSSIIAAIDSLLSCQHASKFMQEMRKYMPKKHREFLLWINEQKPSLQDYCKKNNQLIQSFNHLINELKIFRDRHIQIVTLYIVQQSSKNKSSKNKEVGTGGTSIIPFLKEIRQDMLEQKIN